MNRWDWGRIANSTLTGAFISVVGGPMAAAGILTIAFVGTRMAYSDEPWYNVALDFVNGGGMVDYIGHLLGMGNVLLGGTADWYQGNVVYSRGVVNIMKKMNGGKDFGFAHFGHALYVSDRNNPNLVAHEMRHVAQMEKEGCRYIYIYQYISENGGISFNGSGYKSNPYEIDAYYTEYLYDEGLIDIYGHKKENFNHRDKDIRDGFRRYRPDLEIDENWSWSERSKYGRDY